MYRMISIQAIIPHDQTMLTIIGLKAFPSIKLNKSSGGDEA